MSPVHKYFLGERLQCSMGIVLALSCIALAFWLRTSQATDFYRGLFYPFVIIPLLLLLICTGVVLRTGRDIKRVDQFISSEPEKIISLEIPRMEKVMQNFKWIKLIELSILATGIMILVLYRGTGFMAGLGLGLLLQSLIMYGFDLFAEKRGEVYLDFLKHLNQ